MNNLNEVLKKINEVESSLRKLDLYILGKNIWPLIRISIVKKISPSNFGHKENFSIKSIYYHILDLLRFFELWKMKSKNLFLIYGTDKSGKTLLDNRLIDKHFTPFEDEFGKQNIKFIEFGYIDSSLPKSKALNITLLYFLVKPIFNLYFNVILRKKTSRILTHLRNNDSIESYEVSKSIQEFYSRFIFFKFLLKYIIKPKNLFVKSFDNLTALAIVNAANELKISTVEFQHGQQGENSLSYSNWNNVPKSGYEMLPKYFWVWENRFRRKFDKWMINQSFHEVFVGGNLWYDYIIKKNKHLEFNFKNNFIHVLYCLQYSELNEIVINAMNSCTNIFWHVRLHPRERHKVNDIHKLLISFKIDNFSLIEANNYSFEELILNVEVVVSEWSTVLYEAYCFKKKSITVSNYGRVAYEEFIKDGDIYYADNSKTLLKLINDKTLTENTNLISYNPEAVNFLNI